MKKAFLYEKIEEVYMKDASKFSSDILQGKDIIDCKPAEMPIIANHGLHMIEDEKLTNI